MCSCAESKMIKGAVVAIIPWKREMGSPASLSQSAGTSLMEAGTSLIEAENDYRKTETEGAGKRKREE